MIGERPSFLVIDDNPDDRMLAEHEIRREFAGSQVLAIATSAEFSRALEEDGFDLVITDYHIGWTDGLAVLRAVRQRWPEMPVIMFTGTGSEEIAVAAMKAGLNDYVLKSTKHRGRLAAAMRLALETVQQRRALRAAETRYRDLFEAVPIALYRTTPDGRIVDANQALVDLLGFPDHQSLLGTSAVGSYAVPKERLRWQSEIRKAGIVQGYELTLRRQDGQFRHVLMSARAARDENGEIAYYEGSLEDVTERRAQEARISYAATHDQLTGLPNRRSLEESLTKLLGEPAASDSPAGALLVFDVDNLRLVNDTVGHLAGDGVLLMLIDLIRGHLPSAHLLARANGDEYAIVMFDLTIERAVAVAEDLRQAVEDHYFDVGGATFSLGLSIGLVALDRGTTASGLLARAGAALQRARERGQNRVVVYRREEDDRAEVARENRLVVGLKEALHDRRFVLHYQPIVRLSDGRVRGHEALLRMRAKEGQLVPPGQFVPAAEHFGLMPRLTRWIVEEAVATLLRRPEIRLYVNLSAHCFSSESLLEFIESTLERNGVAPERLGFELTETALVQDFAAAERWILRLRARGCPFALDDFGSGFSSFAYLRNLPFDEIKLDGSLIRSIVEDPTRRHFVQAIQMLAKATDKEVVAEFVEDEATARVLRELGIAYGQGFHLGRPAPEPS